MANGFSCSFLSSVANASAASVFFRVSASVPSVKFRVHPWQMLNLVLALFHTHKPPKFTKFLGGHLVISSGRKIVENFTRIMI